MTAISFGPSQLDLKGIIEADSWLLSISLTVSGAPYNLTGLTCTAQARTDTAVFPITVVVTNAAAGQLTISQSPAPLMSSGTWGLKVGTRTLIVGSIVGIARVV